MVFLRRKLSEYVIADVLTSWIVWTSYCSILFSYVACFRFIEIGRRDFCEYAYIIDKR